MFLVEVGLGETFVRLQFHSLLILGPEQVQKFVVVRQSYFPHT